MRTPGALRLVEITALGVAALGLAACGAMGGSSTASSSGTPSPSGTKPPAAHVAAHITPPVVIGERHTALGTVLTNTAGLTLYTFVLDKDGRSHCTGACATMWPPLMVGPQGTLKSQVSLPHALGSITRSGGRQVTYDGHPLYLFQGDTAPGQTKGEGVKQLWFVATPGGNMAVVAPQPSPSRSSAPRVQATAPRAARPVPAPLPPRMTAAPNPVPQSGGGDHDSDNVGGPNDGDGNV